MTFKQRAEEVLHKKESDFTAGETLLVMEAEKQIRSLQDILSSVIGNKHDDFFPCVGTIKKRVGVTTQTLRTKRHEIIVCRR